ncbi:hypothetical protein [Mesorhizobium sp. M1273]|uniref:hypothetical protein n=1 Tax=Mesorhizobium sp. M1273 TaxID=2957075 RepID=UPI00333DC239
MAGKSPKPQVQHGSIPKVKRPGFSNGGGGGDTPEEGSDPCDIVIEADLESVRADVLATVRVGEALRVEIFEQGGIPSAVCRTADGSPVGSLSALEGLTQLMRCLRNGVIYMVTITELEAGRCHVRGTRVP